MTTSADRPVISDDYLRQQRRLHEDAGYGVASIHYAETVEHIAKQIGAKSLSDYGAGKKRLQQTLEERFGMSLDYRPYDPAFPEYGEPQPADLVCCIDVLEHVELEYIDNVLDDLKAITVRYGFFSIHTRAAMKTLDDGRNAHLIQKPSSWWGPKLFERFEIVNLSPTRGGFTVIVTPRLPHD